MIDYERILPEVNEAVFKFISSKGPITKDGLERWFYDSYYIPPVMIGRDILEPLKKAGKIRIDKLPGAPGQTPRVDVVGLKDADIVSLQNRVYLLNSFRAEKFLYSDAGELTYQLAFFLLEREFPYLRVVGLNTEEFTGSEIDIVIRIHDRILSVDIKNASTEFNENKPEKFERLRNEKVIPCIFAPLISKKTRVALYKNCGFYAETEYNPACKPEGKVIKALEEDGLLGGIKFIDLSPIERKINKSLSNCGAAKNSLKAEDPVSHKKRYTMRNLIREIAEDFFEVNEHLIFALKKTKSFILYASASIVAENYIEALKAFNKLTLIDELRASLLKRITSFTLYNPGTIFSADSVYESIYERCNEKEKEELKKMRIARRRTCKIKYNKTKKWRI
jgi:hypothetical protein